MARRPFHCGSQYENWSDRNCRNCVLGAKEPNYEMQCDIELKLFSVFFGDGNIEEDIFNRMGAEGKECDYVWECPEKQPE